MVTEKVIACILRFCKTPQLKSAIAFHCRVSYNRVASVIEFLVDVGLLNCVGDGKRQRFVVTEKGVRFLSVYGELVGMLKAVSDREKG